MVRTWRACATDSSGSRPLDSSFALSSAQAACKSKSSKIDDAFPGFAYVPITAFSSGLRTEYELPLDAVYALAVKAEVARRKVEKAATRGQARKR